MHEKHSETREMVRALELKLLPDAATCAADLVEIDVSKAFTHAFTEITEIPVFNEFDNFRFYNNEPISLNNMYIVKVHSGNLFQ